MGCVKKKKKTVIMAKDPWVEDVIGRLLRLFTPPCSTSDSGMSYLGEHPMQCYLDSCKQVCAGARTCTQLPASSNKADSS